MNNEDWPTNPLSRDRLEELANLRTQLAIPQTDWKSVSGWMIGNAALIGSPSDLPLAVHKRA
jgi:hypothetical protein